MRIVIFGTGRFYINRKTEIKSFDSNIEIIAFLDNNPDITEMDGKKVLLPQDVNTLQYDRIVLMSTYSQEMLEQLLSYGVNKARIMSWERFRYYGLTGKRQIYSKCEHDASAKKILIISTILAYNGGTMAAKYAAMALLKRGYHVCICAPHAKEACVNEMVDEGLEVVVYPGILAMEKAEKQWIAQFDFVIVNVFQMIACACEVSKIKPVLWWIHENRSDPIYKDIKDEFWDYDDINKLRNINIVAVSNIAKNNFGEYYPELVKHTMPFAIPDEGRKNFTEDKKNIVIAIIGIVIERKGQLDFVKAIEQIPDELRSRCEFWIIGGVGDSAYCQEVIRRSEDIGLVKLFGELGREQMSEVYEQIDVVVCASLEETMSIVVVEGLMKGDVCITTDATGVAEYIIDGVNGYICEAGNANSLADKLQYVIENFDELDDVRQAARETYVKNFTLEAFGERLEEEMNYTKQNYRMDE